MNKLRFIRNVIYRLKRDYGSAVDIYYDQTETVDLDTGTKTISVSDIRVKRAVPLPRKVEENKVLSAAIQELFRRGSVVVMADRQILLDYRDLPKAFRFDRVAYVIFDNARYELISFDDYETHAVVMNLKATSGVFRAANVHLGVESTVQASTTSEVIP
jgi:hypothetical protein